MSAPRHTHTFQAVLFGKDKPRDNNISPFYRSTSNIPVNIRYSNPSADNDDEEDIEEEEEEEEEEEKKGDEEEIPQNPYTSSYSQTKHNVYDTRPSSPLPPSPLRNDHIRTDKSKNDYDQFHINNNNNNNNDNHINNKNSRSSDETTTDILSKNHLEQKTTKKVSEKQNDLFEKLKRHLDETDIQFMYVVAGLTSKQPIDFINPDFDLYSINKLYGKQDVSEDQRHKKRKITDPVDNENIIYNPNYSASLLAARQSLYVDGLRILQYKKKYKAMKTRPKNQRTIYGGSPQDDEEKEIEDCLPSLSELISNEYLKVSFAKLVAFKFMATQVLNARIPSLQVTYDRMATAVSTDRQFLLEHILKKK